MIVFTSICANYTHKARTLAKSVKEHINDAKFFVCLTEREKSSIMNFNYFDEVILSKDMWEGNFNRFIYKHSIVEASTSVKAHFFKYLMNKYPNETEFVYLDPDCYVYSEFIELRQLLLKKPIIVCPHLLQPGNIDMELSATAHGVYNLGFLAVNNSDEANRFIDWWSERLYLFCYDDILRGIFTDQKWIDLAPCFFDVKILKHNGYDFAPWSLLNCNMSILNDQYYVNEDPIRFIHFSGYGATARKCMDDWLPDGEHPFKDLYDKYCIIHDYNNEDNVSKIPWSYDYYYSGEKVDNALRAKYRSDYDVMFSIEDPFALSNTAIKRLCSKKRNLKHYWKSYLYLMENGGIKAVLKKITSIITSS